MNSFRQMDELGTFSYDAVYESSFKLQGPSERNKSLNGDAVTRAAYLLAMGVQYHRITTHTHSPIIPLRRRFLCKRPRKPLGLRLVFCGVVSVLRRPQRRECFLTACWITFRSHQSRGVHAALSATGRGRTATHLAVGPLEIRVRTNVALDTIGLGCQNLCGTWPRVTARCRK